VGDAWEDDGHGGEGTVDGGEEGLASALDDRFSNPEELDEQEDASPEDEPGDE
jgi:hypothetical protein